jgi:hypothetical protein
MLPKGSRAYNPAHSARDHEQKISSPHKRAKAEFSRPFGTVSVFATLPRTSYGATFSRPGKCRDS